MEKKKKKREQKEKDSVKKELKKKRRGEKAQEKRKRRKSGKWEEGVKEKEKIQAKMQGFGQLNKYLRKLCPNVGFLS